MPPKGYNETFDIGFHTIDGYDLSDFWTEFQETIRLLNAQRDPLIDRLIFPVQRPIEKVPQLAGHEFEEADEFGRPVSIRLAEPWNMGFDLRYYDLAQRFTYRFLGESDARAVRALNNEALEADQRLVMRRVLEAIFVNETRVQRLRGGTDVTVYPLYNGSTETLEVAPPDWKSHTHDTSHEHYLVSGGATVVSGDLDDMYEELHHHGYTQGAEIILLANRQESLEIQSFTRAGGDRHDFIPKAGISFLGNLVGSQPTNPSGLAVYPGFQGKYGPISLIEEDYIPPGYMLMVASGGVRAERNLVGLRQHDNASLRGLKLIPRHEHYPLIDSYYHHAFGTGIRHRGAAVVMQVKASGSYEVPDIIVAGPGGR